MQLIKPLWALRLCKRRRLACSVSTWSPLATAFNTRPSTNLMFDKRERTGLFNKPELVTHEGFYELKEQAVQATDRLVTEATDPSRTRPMVEIFDELSDTLCKVADLAEFVRIAHPQPHFAAAAEDACISISGVVEKLNTHRGIYDALSDSVAGGSSGDPHLAGLFLFDFQQSGIQLDEGPRAQVVRLNDVILQAGQQFMAGAAEPRRVPAAAVPKAVRHFFTSDAGGVSVSGVYAECAEAAARETAYRLYLAPSRRQAALLGEVLRARAELAALCGFGSYAERAIRASTMETAANVREFLDTLAGELSARAARDFDTMMKMKRTETSYQDSLQCWDTPYFTHVGKQRLLGGADYSPYLSLGACMEGLDLLCRELYGITLRSEEMVPGESWSADVYKLAVVHEREGLLGYIYCDLYARPGKPHQDCHFTIQGGKLLPNGEYQTPIVVVMLSLAGGHRSGPALLRPSAVDNLWHEFGHALHSMLGRAAHQHVAGTRCATDLAELPSVLSEHFARDPEVVRRFARHFQTGAAMPEDMLQRLCASKHLFAASEMQLQVFYSALDQQYHGPEAPSDTTQVLRDVQARYYGLPYVENTAWQHRFSHLIGYGAKYYAYLVSRALASAAWRRHFAPAPLSRAAGARLRHDVLRHGGARPPQELLRNYLETDITPASLAAALAAELDEQQDRVDRVARHAH